MAKEKVAISTANSTNQMNEIITKALPEIFSISGPFRLADINAITQCDIG
jgi:hypothetical protein